MELSFQRGKREANVRSRRCTKASKRSVRWRKDERCRKQTLAMQKQGQVLILRSPKKTSGDSSWAQKEVMRNFFLSLQRPVSEKRSTRSGPKGEYLIAKKAREFPQKDIWKGSIRRKSLVGGENVRLGKRTGLRNKCSGSRKAE